jgi:LysR family transcriptional regulator, nitrogen assimilation regulatory protein
MDFRQVAYFIAIAEKSSFSGAAAHVRIAQPALSTQIANLEAELGVSLFDRHGRGVTLTSAGRIFLQHAYEIVKRIDAARIAVRDAGPEPTGGVTIGLPMSTSTILAIPIIERVRARHPKIELCVVDGMSGDILKWLREGRLDLAVLYEADHVLPVPSKPLIDDDLYLFGRQATGLSSSRAEIDFHALSEFPLYLSTRSHSLRVLLDHTARDLGVTLNYAGEIDSIPQLKELIYRNGGYTILPRIALGNDVPRDIHLLRVRNPDLQLRSSIAMTPQRPASRAAKCVFNLVPAITRYMLKNKQWPGGHRRAKAGSDSSFAREIPATIARVAVPGSGTTSQERLQRN